MSDEIEDACVDVIVSEEIEDTCVDVMVYELHNEEHATLLTVED